MTLVDQDALILALNSMQDAGGFNSNQVESFQKALTASSGYTGYNLEREVKMRLPAYTVLRNRVAVDPGPVGAMAGPQANYKMQLGYNGFNFGAAMGTGFGANGAEGNPNATNIGANYKSQSIHGSVQLEAIDFARQFTDPVKDQSMFNLQTLMRIEELVVTGGNEYAISAPVPVQGTVAASGAAFAAGTWDVRVSAVTLEGKLRNDSAAVVPAAGIAAGESVTGLVQIVVPVGGAEYLDVKWPVVEGAVGYKVYCESAVASGTVYLCDPATELEYKNGDAFVPSQTGQKWVGVNHLRIIAPPAGTVAYPTVDGSANANQFEGFVAWSTKSTMYGVNLTGTGERVFYDMDGGLFTTDTAGGVKEINVVLQKLWVLYHTAPTLIVGSPATISSLTARIASQSMMRLDLTQRQGRIVGGIMIGGYLNRFAQNAGMPTDIDIIAHPYLPDGFLMLLSETLPPDTYRFAQDSRCFALDVLRPYNYFPLASVDRNINFDIWYLETLKCYYPTAQAAIGGIRVDQ